MSGSTSVALYDTLGVDAGKYIINQTELTTMVVSNDYVKQLSKWKNDDAKESETKLHRLKNIVCFETISDEDKQLAKDADIQLYSFEEVIQKGREAKLKGAQIYEATKDDVYMFSYTSGTTGDPKGVKLTH